MILMPVAVTPVDRTLVGGLMIATKKVCVGSSVNNQISFGLICNIQVTIGMSWNERPQKVKIFFFHSFVIFIFIY